MTEKDEKIVGIIGGMGPEATVDLMQRLIRLTPALDDIDHIRCIVDNNPKIPSRIKAIIEGDGENPGPVMVDMARRLESYGADLLAIPCNTAHHYYDDVAKAVEIPVLNIVELVAHHIDNFFPHLKKIGMLASPAVRMTRLYKTYFERLNIEDIWPESYDQDRLFKIIRDVKMGHVGPDTQKAYEEICQGLNMQGADLAIVGCTELSALGGKLPIPVVDASDVLARAIVQIVKQQNP